MTIAIRTETDGRDSTSAHRIGRRIFLVYFSIGAKECTAVFLKVKAVRNNEFSRAILC